MNITAQVFGVLAFIASVLSFQLKTYRQILIAQIICASLFVVHFALLYFTGEADALTGAGLNAVCVVRNILLLLTAEKRTKKGTVLIAAVFSVIVIVIGILTWNSWVSALFIVAMILNTVAMSVPDPNTVRIFIMLSAPFACAYDVLNASIGGSVNEAVSFLSALIGFLRYRKKDAVTEGSEQSKKE